MQTANHLSPALFDCLDAIDRQRDRLVSALRDDIRDGRLDERPELVLELERLNLLYRRVAGALAGR